jgi:hypothetical protein
LILQIPGIHEPAGYGTTVLKAQNDDMLTILGRLQLHGPVMSITVPRTGLTSPVEFTAQMKAALTVHGLSLPPSPSLLTDAEAAQFTKQPWALLSPICRSDVLTFKPHPTINANTFGMDEFTKLGRKFTNPDPSAGPSSVLILAGRCHSMQKAFIF